MARVWVPTRNLAWCDLRLDSCVYLCVPASAESDSVCQLHQSMHIFVDKAAISCVNWWGLEPSPAQFTKAHSSHTLMNALTQLWWPPITRPGPRQPQFFVHGGVCYSLVHPTSRLPLGHTHGHCSLAQPNPRCRPGPHMFQPVIPPLSSPSCPSHGSCAHQWSFSLVGECI